MKTVFALRIKAYDFSDLYLAFDSIGAPYWTPEPGKAQTWMADALDDDIKYLLLAAAQGGQIVELEEP